MLLQPRHPWLRMLANMKFIGNLFLRQLLAVKVIGQAVSVQLKSVCAMCYRCWINLDRLFSCRIFYARAARWYTTWLALKMEERFQKNI